MSHQTRRQARIQRQRRRRGRALLIISLLSGLFVAAYLLWEFERSAKTTAIASVDRPTSAEPPRPPQPPEPPAHPPPARGHAFEELHSKVLGISRSRAGTQGVVVFDPSSRKTISLNADRRFVAASLSKLYALLTLYRSASRGELSLDDKITMHSSDVWAYGTGVLGTNPGKYPVGYTMTLRECARFMIKESDNTAELMLNRYLGEEKIEAELRRIGATSTRYWQPTNTTTPNDILLVLKAIADPAYTTQGLSTEMLELMTDTSFENRLPQPLPEDTSIAHKIGSYESTFSDAGIVFPEQSGGTGMEYYIVVFSEGTTEEEAREAIQDISLAAYQALSRPDAP